MLSLPVAVAYIVKYTSEVGKLSKLGKMKLFKILYLADWEKFRNTNQPLFELAWYRIQKGPALKPKGWQDLCVAISEEFGIKTEWEQGASYAQVKFSITGSLELMISNENRGYLEKAIDSVIDTTADAAAKLTYQTDPMKWLVAQELPLGGRVQFREFYINDDERVKFAELARKYEQGLIDIPGITQQMGEDWTNYNVVLFLQVLERNRKLSDIQLKSKDREDALQNILRFSLQGNLELSSKWVEDTVISSQRIEGIYVTPDAFVEETTLAW